MNIGAYFIWLPVYLAMLDLVFEIQDPQTSL